MNAIAIAPLSLNEMYDTNGGEVVWYYLCYGLGWFARAYMEEQLEITNAIGNGRR
jgi:hypothetical protein